jgi:hypothetical protein
MGARVPVPAATTATALYRTVLYCTVLHCTVPHARVHGVKRDIMSEDKRGCDLINACHGNATDRTECERETKTARRRNRGAARDIQGDSTD